MAYLVNPTGRTVQVDDQDQIDKLLASGEFRLATPEEERDHISKREKMIQRMRYNADLDEEGLEKAVYIATVAPGGKDGYSVAAEALITGLQDMGIKISTYKKDQKIGFLFHSPQSLIKLENPIKVIYTMFESDKIPDEWKDYLELADKIYVPSRWCMEVFAKEGIATEVIPLGYDDTVFKYKERYNKGEKHEPFVFLHYNAFNARKGFLEVFNAFKLAFTRDEPVKLILKTNMHQLPAFPITPEMYPNIEVINQAMSGEELRELIYKSDCNLFPSRGEGFGIPPLESMACGVPAIVPNAHGISEYFNPEFMYEAKVEGPSPALYTRYKGVDVGNMIKCDVDALAAQMRYVYEHQDEALEKGKKASEYVKNWTFRKTAESFKKVFEELMEKEIDRKNTKNILLLEEVS